MGRPKENLSLQLNLISIAYEQWIEDGKPYYYGYSQYYNPGEKFKIRLEIVKDHTGKWIGWYNMRDLRCGLSSFWVR